MMFLLSMSECTSIQICFWYRKWVHQCEHERGFIIIRELCKATAFQTKKTIHSAKWVTYLTFILDRFYNTYVLNWNTRLIFNFNIEALIVDNLHYIDNQTCFLNLLLCIECIMFGRVFFRDVRGKSSRSEEMKKMFSIIFFAFHLLY